MPQADGLLEDCGGPFDLTPDHTISSFESQPTSWADERGRGGDHGVLAVGFEFAADLAEYVGITISLPELELFEQECAGWVAIISSASVSAWAWR